jgi:hypothetical protein
MTLRVPELSDAAVSAIVADIDRIGYAMIPDFIVADDLARMRRFVAGAVERSDGEYAGFVGPDSVSDSGLDDLARSQSFQDMMHRIYERGTGDAAPKQDFYQLLRCLTGQSVRVHSFLFHYDSYVVTALIPIEIPTTGRTGDFLMIPNTRPIRKNRASNLADKVLLDNRATQWLLRSLTALGVIRPVRIKMVPGNAYFFWGYRSVHTNEPCDPNKVRATALFHYVNPHAGEPLLSIPRFRAPVALQR